VKPLAIIVMFAWNTMVLGYTAYQVFERGRSGWWFLVALLCLASFKSDD
jgi:hypothetical protein